MTFDITHWQTGEWAIAVAILVFVGGLIIQQVIYRVRNPPSKVRIELDVVSLLNRRVSTPDIKVFAGEEQVSNPHFVDISITAVGRRDVSRESFDGEPITVNFLGAEIRRNLTPESIGNQLIQVSPTEVRLDPTLLKAGGKSTPFVGRFLCAGSPSFSIPQSLRDTDIDDVVNTNINKGPPTDHWNHEMMVFGMVIGAAAGVFVGVAVSVMAVLSSNF